MVWVLISASFSTFTYTSAAMPIPASPLSLHPFVSSAFFVHCMHPMSKGLLSLFIFIFFLPISFCISSLPFCPLFSLGNCCLHPLPPVVAPSKKKKKKNERGAVVGSEPSGMGLHEVSRSFSPPSPGSNIQSWHQCTGSGHPGDVQVRDLSPPPTGDAAGRLPAAHRSWSWSN